MEKKKQEMAKQMRKALSSDDIGKAERIEDEMKKNGLYWMGWYAGGYCVDNPKFAVNIHRMRKESPLKVVVGTYAEIFEN